MTSAEAPLPLVADHEILKPIGGGSYGGVWLARSAAGQLRAIKVVMRKRFSSERPYEREFAGIRQFEPISRSHPGVVHILHVGRDDTAGYFYYVMEIADAVDGDPAAPLADYEPRTLASELKARGRLPQIEVLALGVQLAGALDHIHRHRLVHRDVKPSNVIFVDGQAKLADIGLVTGADEAKSFVGTEGFIPPEGPGSTQADIFGLGRLLYEAATGKDRCDFPDLPGELDAWPASERSGLMELNEILSRACAPKASERHANAAELAGDLNVLLAGRSIRRVYGNEHRARRATQIIGIAVLTALLALGASWFQQSQRRQAEERAGREAALRGRAEAAEGRAREDLRASLLNQALALTSSSEVDRRTRALAAIKAAAKIRPGIDLRNAAIAALTAPELRVVRQWSLPATDVLASRPDRQLRRYMRWNSDRTVSVHSIENDAELLRLPPAGSPADFGTFSPDGSWLAVKYRDNVLGVWNLSAHTQSLVVGNIALFAFTPDSRRLIAARTEGHLQVFDLASGRESARQPLGYVPGALAVHPTEPIFLISGLGRRGIEIRRLEDGTLVRRLDAPEMGLAADWTADGKSLITAHGDFSVRVWDWPSMNAPRLVLRLHRAEPVFLATDPAGRFLMSVAWDSQAFLVDLRDGRLLSSQAAQAVYAAGDRPAFLLTNNVDWTLVELQPPFALEEVPLHEKDKGPREAVFSASGRWLATGGPDGIRILDRTTREVLRVMDDAPALRIAFSADATRLYAITLDRLCAWELRTDPSTSRLRAERIELPGLGDRHFRDATSAEIFDGGERWLSIWRGPTAGHWSWAEGRFASDEIDARGELEPGSNDPRVSPDGRWLAWGNWHGHDAAIRRMGSHDPPVVLKVAGSVSVAFSPDSRLLAVGGSEEIRFYDVGTLNVVHTIPRQPSRPLSPVISFTRGSSLCAITLPPEEILLADTATGSELARLPASSFILWSVSFAPDDRFLAATSSDHRVLIWDIPKLRQELRELGLDW
ncbi:MAG TPA: WD40 repeat domain-containing serine/threonine-protein kinase [Candidatus Polarisedimenticolaceae bacterium]|nr:WD40 repeat domain-containing serine/threonine-protein kinase [Candidatus Polarisedimenticolaceae bacterium]